MSPLPTPQKLHIDYRPAVSDTPGLNRLLGDKRRGTTAHAYLLVSADELLTTLTAELFARVAAAPSDIMRLPLARDSGKVLVEDINRLTEDCIVRPIDGDKKVYIIERAGTMTDQAQNKLLKTLEEPPESVIIILCAAEAAQLLSTVRSRSRKIDCPGVTPDALYRHLTASGVAPAEADFAARFSLGNLSTCARVLESPRFHEAYESVRDTFLSLKRSPDILRFAARLAAFRDIPNELLDMFALLARDIMAAASGKPELIFTYAAKNDIISLASDFDPLTAAGIIERVLHAKKSLYYNCNFQSVIDELLFSFLEVKASANRNRR